MIKKLLVFNWLKAGAFLAVFAAAFLVCCPASVFAEEVTTYDITNGAVTITVDSSSARTYVINGSGTQTSNTISISGSGTVNITLNNVNIQASTCPFSIAPGVTVNLTLVGNDRLYCTSNEEKGSNYAGLRVPSGAVLNITADSSGSIEAHGGRYSAGIGGNANESSGMINIYGGGIHAIGGIEGAGIGGGVTGNGGNIIINSGSISAEGGRGAAGIGGGNSGSLDSLVINGGNVLAAGGKYLNSWLMGGASAGAGIGGGGGFYQYSEGGDGGSVTINGGTVNVSTSDLADAAGIGGGGLGYDPTNNVYKRGGSAKSLTVNGGYVIVSAYSNAIGGGPAGDAGIVTINGGYLEADSYVDYAIRGGGALPNYSAGDGPNLTVNGGTLITKGNGAKDIGGGFGSESNGSCTINGGSVKAMPEASVYNSQGAQEYLTTVTEAELASSDISYRVDNGSAIACRADSDGKLYLWLPAGSSANTVTVNKDTAVYTGSGTVSQSGTNSVALSFSGYDLSYGNLAITQAGDYTVCGSSDVHSISVSGPITANITLNDVALKLSAGCPFSIGTGATVNLTLAGDNILQGGAHSAGLYVPDGAVLNITAASTGTLSASGGDEGAGIGGAINSGGTITISGGTVTANGGECGAGIGGGYLGAGGSVVIKGGTVTAVGGTNGSGIGNGSGTGVSGTCIISGGSVTASTIGPVVYYDDAKTKKAYPVTVSLPDIPSTAVSYTVNSGSPASCSTDSSGGLYLWLPLSSSTTLVFSHGSNSYTVSCAVAEGATNSFTPTMTSYGLAGGSVSITKSGTYSVTSAGDTTPNNITISGGITAYLTLDNADIDVSAKPGTCAFAIGSGSTVYLTVTGSNTLKSGLSCAGINVHNGTVLQITADSSGTLTVTGGDKGAGIGGGGGSTCGTIRIGGGTIVANGGVHAAGIGGGDIGDGGSVVISGGSVTTTGGPYGAGIGGGDRGSGGTVKISSGTVIVAGSSSVEGIGKGSSGSDNGSCYISGGSVHAGSVGPDVYEDSSKTTRVYLTTITLPLISKDITYSVNSGSSISCSTDSLGKLYLWLPASDATNIRIQCGSTDYTASGKVNSVGANSLTAAETMITYKDSDGTIIQTASPSVSVITPFLYGYKFAGWSKDSTGTVWTAQYQANSTKFTVNVNNGSGGGTFNYQDSDTVIANAPPSGKVFEYWKDEKSNIVCYSSTYTFTVVGSVSLSAFYGSGVTPSASINIKEVIKDSESSAITFIAVRCIPSGCTMVSNGILLTSSVSIGANGSNFIIGASNVINHENKMNGLLGTFVLSKANVSPGETWYARCYAVYKDAGGNQHTIYSNIASGSLS